jgi:hypothetical protein
MAWLLRDTRSSMLLGGGVLSAITVAIGLEAAFSSRAVRPGVVGVVNVGSLTPGRISPPRTSWSGPS